MSTAMNSCPICGYPIAPSGIPWGYAGPVCGGHPQYQYGTYTFTPAPLTADDVRRIVREELERASSTSTAVKP